MNYFVKAAYPVYVDMDDLEVDGNPFDPIRFEQEPEYRRETIEMIKDEVDYILESSGIDMEVLETNLDSIGFRNEDF